MLTVGLQLSEGSDSGLPEPATVRPLGEEEEEEDLGFQVYALAQASPHSDVIEVTVQKNCPWSYQVSQAVSQWWTPVLPGAF